MHPRSAPFFLCALWLCATIAWADAPGTQPVPYFTAFRVTDLPPFEAGQTIEGRNGWHVSRGRAAVSPFHGMDSPALLIEPNSIVERPMATAGSPVIWAAVSFRTAGGPRSLPQVPQRPLSSVLLFDAVRGIEALDGNGVGGGALINASAGIGADRWRRLAIRYDFPRQEYDLYVDSTPRLVNLGFRDNVTQFNGFLQGTSGSPAGLTNVFINTGPPPDVPFRLGDVRTNGLINAGDVVKLVNALRGTDTLTFMERINADVDENEAVDETDLSLLIDIILGVRTFP